MNEQVTPQRPAGQRVAEPAAGPLRRPPGLARLAGGQALAVRYALPALLALGLLIRLAFALQPLEQLLIWLEDDAWMVQAIARNFARGLGVSADGISPTNGFHPLYPLALGSLPYLVDGRPHGIGLPANMLLCALLNTLALLPLYGIARRFVRAPFALLALALVALNLSLVRLSVNGMETSLALLMSLTLLYLYLRDEPATPRAGLWLGLFAGAAVLARLDTVLLIGAIGLVWGWRVLGRQAPPLPWLAFAAAVGLVFGAYLLVNQLVFGNPSPSSGRALSYMHSYAGSFSLFNGLGIVSLNPLLPIPALGPAPVALLALLAALGVSLYLVRGAARVLLAIIGLYAALVAIYYGYLMQHLQPRYLVLLGALSAVWLALLAQGLGHRAPRLARLGGALALLAVVAGSGWAALGFFARSAAGPQLTQPAMYAAARWMAQNLPADAVVGAKNSGIYQFYSERTVVNLDGKLNGEMIAVLERRGLLDYMRQRGIMYVVERDSVLLPWLGQYSAQLADAPPHRTPGTRERLAIYTRLLLSRLGLAAPPALDTPYSGPVDASGLLVPLERFARANSPADPVVIYLLNYP
jgi:hypothetical protein